MVSLILKKTQFQTVLLYTYIVEIPTNMGANFYTLFEKFRKLGIQAKSRDTTLYGWCDVKSHQPIFKKKTILESAPRISSTWHKKERYVHKYML